MSKMSALEAYRKANEEEFFTNKNTDSLNRLRIRGELKNCGIEKQQLADSLINSGFDSDSCRAIILFPLVELAWLSGKIEFEETECFNQILEEYGVFKSSSAYELIHLWLEDEPQHETRTVLQNLNTEIVTELKITSPRLLAQLNGWAHRLASSYQGLLSFSASPITEKEAEFLASLKSRTTG